MDDDERALAECPDLAARMAYHMKRLRVIQYVSGAEGVAAYKAKFAEAKTIQTRATTIAFQSKPEGYARFLCGLVDTWFISDLALAETNKADVGRLNDAVHPRRFNPDNHFSKPIAGSLVGKLADVFAKHGAHLDTSKPLSMAKVRAAVKAAKGKRSAGRPFGQIGHVADGQLFVGDQSFAIQRNGSRECIRPTINGCKRRLYLDELIWMMKLLGPAGRSGIPLSVYSSIEDRIGDRDYSPGNSSEPDPLADILPENGTSSMPLQSGDRGYSPDEPPPLSDRIAALRTAQAPHSSASADDADPLAFERTQRLVTGLPTRSPTTPHS